MKKLSILTLALLALNASALGASAFADTSKADPETVCPVMGNPTSSSSISVFYGSLVVRFCCDGCDDEFLASPSTYLEKAGEGQAAVADFLFDPVSQSRLEVADAVEVVTFRGIRYPFASKENAEAFRELPGTYVGIPAKESLKCPVMKNTVENPAQASGYADYAGVRYYFCCAGCDTKFKADPAKYSTEVASAVRPIGGGKAPAKQSHAMAPTCAGCAGEARLMTGDGLAAKWMVGYRYVGTPEVAPRHRFTLDYALTPRVTVGIERSGSDAGMHPVISASEDFFDWLRTSDGDAFLMPRATWFATPQGRNHPSVVFGMASDRLSTPHGQAFFVTFAKSIPSSTVTPFVSVKTNSYDGKTVAPFGVNFGFGNDHVLQVINDGDYTHWLFTRMFDKTAVSLLYAKTQYWGFSVSMGF
jgi:YHS domain-containing protein